SCTCVQPVLLNRSRIITRSGAPVAVVAASGPPDVIIDDVLQPLLLAAPLLGLPVLDGEGAQVREGELAALELAPAAFVEAGIAALPELRQRRLREELVRDQEPPGERVHAPDVGDEHVLQVGGLPPNLGIEIQ